MSVYKDDKNGNWYVMVRYDNWKGERKQKCKRGFSTKKDAQKWERSFLLQTSADMEMMFEDFVEIYTRDMKSRLKETTWLTKENIINTKILPYFGKRKINEIQTKDVIAWQNEMIRFRDEKGKPYSATYLISFQQYSITLSSSMAYLQILPQRSVIWEQSNEKKCYSGRRTNTSDFPKL